MDVGLILLGIAGIFSVFHYVWKFCGLLADLSMRQEAARIAEMRHRYQNGG